MAYTWSRERPRSPRARRLEEDQVIGTGEHINPKKIVEAFERRGLRIRLTDDGEHLFVEPSNLLSVGDLVRLSAYKENLLQFLSGSRRRI